MKMLKILIFPLFIIIVSLFLFLVFILQGALSIHASVYLLPLYLLPFPLTVFCVSIFFLGLFKKPSKLLISAAFSALALLCVVLFQMNRIDPYFSEVKLVGPFSKSLSSVSIKENFKKRLAASTFEGINFFAITKADKEMLSFLRSIVKESLFIKQTKLLFEKNHLQETCHNYAQAEIPYDQCIVEFHRSMLKSAEITSTGNALLIANSLLGIFNLKEMNIKIVPNQKTEIIDSSFMDIMEITFYSLENTLSNLYKPINKETSLSVLLEKQINQKFAELSLVKIHPAPKDLEARIRKRNNTNEVRRLEDLYLKIGNIKKEIEHYPKLKEKDAEKLFFNYKNESLFYKTIRYLLKDPEQRLLQSFSHD